MAVAGLAFKPITIPFVNVLSEVHELVVDKERSDATYCQEEVEVCQTLRARVLPVLNSSESNQNCPFIGFAGGPAETMAVDGGMTASRTSLFATSS